MYVRILVKADDTVLENCFYYNLCQKCFPKQQQKLFDKLPVVKKKIQKSNNKNIFPFLCYAMMKYDSSYPAWSG